MKCFYSPSQDAIGICKSCGRGVSADQMTDMGKGLACKGRCEDDVKSLMTLIEQNISSSSATNQILKRSPNAGYGSGVFLTVMGLIFIFTGLKNPTLGFTFNLGIGFLAFGIWTFIRVRKDAAIVAKLPTTTDSQP